MVNGFCIPCHESCNTCASANGTSDTDCVTCHHRHGIEPGTGKCIPCHPSCLTCSVGMNASKCTMCFLDSSLLVNTEPSGGFFCTCDFPKVRLVSSLTCENACPSGNGFNDSKRECAHDATEDEVVYIELSTPVPIYNTAAGNQNIVVDSCFPPTAFSPTVVDSLTHHRGSYFDGIRDFLELRHFVLDNTFTLAIWARPYSGDSSLSYFETEQFNGWEHLNHSNECKGDQIIEHWDSYFDFWLAPCYSLVADLGDENRLVSSE